MHQTPRLPQAQTTVSSPPHTPPTSEELIRQYHERADLTPLMADEDFDGLVL